MASTAMLQLVQIILSIGALVTHLIAISTSYWAYYYPANSYDFMPESGHYGFWTYCYYRPHLAFEREMCYSIDGMYRPPPYLNLAAIFAVVTAIVFLLFIPFAFLRMRQTKYDADGQLMVNRSSGGVKLALAVIATLLAGLVLILVSVREREISTDRFYPNPMFYGFLINKGWSFYLEAVAAIIGLLLIALCIMEGNQSLYQSKHNRHDVAYGLGGSKNSLKTGHPIQPTAQEPLSSSYQPCSDSSSSGERRARSPTRQLPRSVKHVVLRPVSPERIKPQVPTGSFRRTESRGSLQQLQSDNGACTSAQCQLTSQSFERIPRVRSPASVRFSGASQA